MAGIWTPMLWLCGPVLLLGLTCVETSEQTFDRSDYALCNKSSEQNQGFSSIEIDGYSYWTHCGFPNPRYNVELCGRSSFGAERDYLLCDPDTVLTDNVLGNLDQSLWTLSDQTPYQCKTLLEEKMNFVVLLVVVKYLRQVDLTVASDVCINDCYEVQPLLDLTQRNATDDEQQVSLQSFAQGLIDNWETSFCDNTVAVVYWAPLKLLATATGRRASNHLTKDKVTKIQTEAQRQIDDGYLLEGLEYMVVEYQRVLIGFSPALILLCVYCSFLLLLIVFLVAVFGFGRSTVGGYWDEGKGKIFVKTALKVVCGVWLVEMLIMSLIRLEEKARFWWTLVPLAGFVGCLVGAFVISQTEETTSSVNITAL